MNLENKLIFQICEEIISSNGFLLIDIQFKNHPNSKLIEVFIDSKSSLTIDDCSKISKEICSQIEDQNIIKSPYRLEVSSPGIDRSLKYLAQYFKNINRNFEVHFLSNDLEKTIKAKLLRIENEDLIFQFNENELTINFKDIKKAKVQITFS